MHRLQVELIGRGKGGLSAQVLQDRILLLQPCSCHSWHQQRQGAAGLKSDTVSSAAALFIILPSSTHHDLPHWKRPLASDTNEGFRETLNPNPKP